ncbi:MAG: hypothetical protein U5R48_09955 [Gammaproteobacteria bacterium]|nr:hypothetical protein [Gammaproteobacteria bacterium]
MVIEPENVSAETHSEESVSRRKLAITSACLGLAAILLGARVWWALTAGHWTSTLLYGGCAFGLLATSLRPRLLFRRWNDSSEWPRPETVRGRRLDLVSRILINIGVTLVLLGALVKLFTLI